MPLDRSSAPEDGVAAASRPAARLSDRVYEALRQQIEQETWAQGTRMPPEAELVRRFDVSRPVVRAALARLKAAGWIVTRQGSGSVVTRPAEGGGPGYRPVQTVADLIQSFEFRFSVECDSARYAALRRSASQMKAIEQAHGLMRDPITEEARGDADMQFHLAVARASGNPLYARTLAMLQVQVVAGMRISSVFTNTQESRAVDIHRQHLRIVQAIRARDGQAAHEAMAAHLRSARLGLLGFEPDELRPAARARSRAGQAGGQRR